MQACVDCSRVKRLKGGKICQVSVNCLNLPESNVAYNPSSVFQIGDKTFLFVRVEPFPYVFNKSAVWLAQLEFSGSFLLNGLNIRLVRKIQSDLSLEDPYIFELSESHLILGLVEIFENTPWMRFYLIPKKHLLGQEQQLCIEHYPNFRGPRGMKGIRFFNDTANRRLIVFFRPHKDYHQGSFWGEAEDSLKGIVTKSEIHISDQDDEGIFEMLKEVVNGFQDSSYLRLPNVFGQDNFHWTGLNGVMPWGDKFLIVYHVGKFDHGGRKLYKAILTLTNKNFEFEDDSFGVSREEFLVDTKYKRGDELFDVVYPSGPSLIKTQDQEQLLILCGISDCEIAGMLVAF